MLSETVKNPLVEDVLEDHVEDVTWAESVFQIRSNEVDGKKKRKPRVILLLLILGVCSGVLNGLILWGTSSISKVQVLFISLDSGNETVGLIYLLLSTCSFVCVSAFACKTFAKNAAGSGLPEFKYLLASELPEQENSKLVSVKVFFTKSFGLILAAGSSLSIGSEGPLVHTAACIAHFLMRYVGEFSDIFESPALTKQIYAASAAVGVSSAFNAPVGGLLFSIEVTSTFYLVSNYWKSFVAATAGSLACNLFLIVQGIEDPLLALTMSIDNHPYKKAELLAFLLMGVLLGFLAVGYLKLHQLVGLFMKKYTTPYPVVTAGMAAFFTAIVVYCSGSYSSSSVGVIAMVSDVLSTGTIADMAEVKGMHPVLGLFLSLLCRVVLTLIGTNVSVPCGIFMPVFLIGGLSGRIVGTIMSIIFSSRLHIQGYALVGACGFAAGITHTISVAVIAVEMTGNMHMMLPCLLVSVIAAGVAKKYGLSVYDQGMVNKGMESFQLLLMECGKRKVARDVMSKTTVAIPRNSTVTNLVKILEATDGKQQFFAVVDENKALMGTLNREDIFVFLRKRFIGVNQLDSLYLLLPNDTASYLKVEKRKNQRIAAEQRKSLLVSTFNVLTDETLLFGHDPPSSTNKPSPPAPILSPAIPSQASQAVSQAPHSTPSSILKKRHIKATNESVEVVTTDPGLLSRSPCEEQQTEPIVEAKQESTGPKLQIDVTSEFDEDELTVNNNINNNASNDEVENSDIHRVHMNPNLILPSPKKPPIPSLTLHPEDHRDDIHEYDNENHDHNENRTRPYSYSNVSTITASEYPMTSRTRTQSSDVFDFRQLMQSIYNAVTDEKLWFGDDQELRERNKTNDIEMNWAEAGEDYSPEKEVVVGGTAATAFRRRKSSIATGSPVEDAHERASASQALLLESFNKEFDISAESSLKLNCHPFTVLAEASMEQVYVLFEMVKVSCVAVVGNGKVLLGMITRRRLMDSLKENIGKE